MRRVQVTFAGDANGFAQDAAGRLADWIMREAIHEPFAATEAIVVDAEGDPERLPRAELVARLRRNDMESLARRVERKRTAAGHTLTVVIGESVELREIETADIGAVRPPPARSIGEYVPGEPWRNGKWIAPAVVIAGSNGRRTT